jgi:two-component system, OmpR family, sensor histidine kinase CpxA
MGGVACRIATMPRHFFNLYARILLWLLVNVLVLGGGFWIVLQWQFREGMQGVLGGIVGDRLQNIGREIHGQISAKPRAEWNQLFAEFGARHGVQAALVTLPDRIIAGARIELPDEMKRVLQDMHPELTRRPPPRAGQDDRPPPHRDEVERLLFGEDFIPGPPGGDGGPRFDDAASAMPIKLGTFMLPVGTPPVYYTGIRLPLIPGWNRREGPLIFMIVTSRITGGGLFFDVKPWLLGLFGAMALSALLWLPFVSGITRSVRANMHATEQIARGRFDVRVPENRRDELGRLSHAVNQMAAQLDGIVRGQKRFLGDIAHELCSPMARMEMSLGILEDRLTDNDALRLADAREELRQMSALVHELLSFSKTTLASANKPAESVPLLVLIDEVVGIEAIPPQKLRVAVPADLIITCIPDLLRRSIGNILRNARLHAPESDIEVSAVRKGDHIHLRISDNGPGVPAESLARLFEPFYRVDTSRDRQTGGSGLGLAIVKTCVETCGGSVSVRANEPHGLVFEMELPRA